MSSLIALLLLGAASAKVAFSQCPSVICEKPEDGCVYEASDEVNSKGCPTYPCGILRCKCDSNVLCPLKEGCRYVLGKDDVDSRGCATGCGTLVCDECPLLKCPARPTGDHCELVKKAIVNEAGCQTTCDSYECTCPLKLCNAPAGCRFEVSDRHELFDPETGCQTSCGKLVCCFPTPCAPPPPGCDYDGDAPVDENGCKNGCGNLVCEPEPCPVVDCAVDKGCTPFDDGLVDINKCRINPCAAQCPCPIADCAAPPDGCAYVEGDLDPNTQCRQQCQLKCDTDRCPQARCALPEAGSGCVTVENNALNSKGCPAFPCGETKCSPCPMALCAALPDHCHYVEGDVDPDTNCRRQCQFKCDACPRVARDCAVPEGQQLVDSGKRDQYGCVADPCHSEPVCAELSCAVPPGCTAKPAAVDDAGCPTECEVDCSDVDCPQPRCGAVPDHCTVTESDERGADGCAAFPCGKLECDECDPAVAARLQCAAAPAACTLTKAIDLNCAASCLHTCETTVVVRVTLADDADREALELLLDGLGTDDAPLEVSVDAVGAANDGDKTFVITARGSVDVGGEADDADDDSTPDERAVAAQRTSARALVAKLQTQLDDIALSVEDETPVAQVEPDIVQSPAAESDAVRLAAVSVVAVVAATINVV